MLCYLKNAYHSLILHYTPHKTTALISCSNVLRDKLTVPLDFMEPEVLLSRSLPMVPILPH